MKTFPTLFKKSSTGKMLQWRIWVDDTTIKEEHGQVGGKLQETAGDTIKTGKNTGKANATTAEEQAILEAESKWSKKLKNNNYNEDRAKAEKGESSEVVEGGIIPMLAKRFDEDGDKIVWPAAGQHKYDGHRCTAVFDSEGKVTLWSRTRKPINSMVHIQKALESLNYSNMVLDGELYNTEYHDRFEQLTHFIRQEEPKPGCEIVHYHVYDMELPNDFNERSAIIKGLLKNAPKCIVIAETFILEDEDDMMLLFEKFLKQGYEGLMLRNLKGGYANKRSTNLQKVKKFIDSEFKIVGIVEGRGKLTGHGIFECVNENGIKFTAKMVGEISELKKYFEHPEKYIGKMLTVKYQGLTGVSKNGVAKGLPRFPVALRIAESL